MSEETIDTTSGKEWVAIRGECISGGALTDNCNLVAASQGKAAVNIVRQVLSCGCILVPEDGPEDVII